MSDQAEQIAKALYTVDEMNPEDEALPVGLLDEVTEEPKERRYHEPSDDWLEWD